MDSSHSPRRRLDRAGPRGTDELATRVIANVRLIPEIAEHYPEVTGSRNQIEAFFDWIEQCFYRHDRAASWGRDAQILDLIAAGLLHNAETWAHLAYRDPGEPQQLTLRRSGACPLPTSARSYKKPKEERKRQLSARLHQPMRAAAMAQRCPRRPGTGRHGAAAATQVTRERLATRARLRTVRGATATPDPGALMTATPTIT